VSQDEMKTIRVFVNTTIYLEHQRGSGQDFDFACASDDISQMKNFDECI
jgi:hypothetical protein